MFKASLALAPPPPLKKKEKKAMSFFHPGIQQHTSQSLTVSRHCAKGWDARENTAEQTLALMKGDTEEKSKHTIPEGMRTIALWSQSQSVGEVGVSIQ